jgi:hypothetical protein
MARPRAKGKMTRQELEHLYKPIAAQKEQTLNRLINSRDPGVMQRYYSS